MNTAETTVQEDVAPKKVKSALNTRFYSHATLDCKDIDSTRQFFEEFLGFETVLMAPNNSFWSRMGGDQVIVVIKGPRTKAAMPFQNHNGLDVETEADVDEAYKIVNRDAEKWGLHKISKPIVRHGTYGFYFWDRDDNCWEILSNPKGGYMWGFERGDQSGRGHLSRDFVRPESTITKER